MKSSLTLNQLETLQEVLEKQSEDLVFHAKSLGMLLKPRNPNLMAIVVNPKELDIKFKNQWKTHQEEYSNYFQKVMSNFEVTREYFQKYCPKDEFVQKLLDMESEISKFRIEEVYPQYPDMQEIESVVIRNDFIFEEKRERLFQTENNMIAVGGTHFHEQLQKLLNKMFFCLDLKKQFKSRFIIIIMLIILFYWTQLLHIIIIMFYVMLISDDRH